MKRLELIALVVKYDTAVCEHTVNVKDKKFDALGDFKKFSLCDAFQLFPRKSISKKLRKVIDKHHLEKLNTVEI